MAFSKQMEGFSRERAHLASPLQSRVCGAWLIPQRRLRLDSRLLVVVFSRDGLGDGAETPFETLIVDCLNLAGALRFDGAGKNCTNFLCRNRRSTRPC